MLLTIIPIELIRVRRQSRRPIIIMSVLETAEERRRAGEEVLCLGHFVEAETAVEEVAGFGGEVHPL